MPDEEVLDTASPDDAPKLNTGAVRIEFDDQESKRPSCVIRNGEEDAIRVEERLCVFSQIGCFEEGGGVGLTLQPMQEPRLL